MKIFKTFKIWKILGTFAAVAATVEGAPPVAAAATEGGHPPPAAAAPGLQWLGGSTPDGGGEISGGTPPRKSPHRGK